MALVSILLTVGIRYGWPVISGLVFASSEVDVAMAGFLRIFALGVFFHTMNLTCTASLSGPLRTRPPRTEEVGQIGSDDPAIASELADAIVAIRTQTTIAEKLG